MARFWRFTCSNGHAPVTWDVEISNAKALELVDHVQYRYKDAVERPVEVGAPVVEGVKAAWMCCATCGSDNATAENVET